MVDGTENHERNLLVLENDHAAVSSKVEAVKEICRFDTLRSIKNDGDLLTRFLSAVIKFLETYPNECSKAVLDVLESAISDIVKLRDTFPLTSNLLNIICAVVRTGELELLSANNVTERKSEDKYSAGKDGLPDKLVRLMKCLNLCDKSVMWDKLGGAPNFATYIGVILKCMNMRGSSDSVLTDLRQQTLGTVFRIFSNVKHTSVKPVSNETLNEWVEILLSLVFDSNRDIQKSAVHAFQLMWTCLAASGWTKDFVCSPELKKQIKSDYCPKLIKLVESPERVEPSWEVVWCLLVDLLANQLLSNQNSQLTNSMLAVEERAFKRSDRAPAFKCWKYLIEKLCASNGQDIKRHLKLLLQPLVISNTKNEQLIRLKHEVFWFFVCCAAPLCDECGVILNAFLRFNFGIPDQTDLSHFNLSVSNSSVTGNGKHAFSGLKRNFHIFRSGCIDRLAQVLSPTSPESRDDFEFESPKLSVAMIKSPAQFLRLHPLIIYCACSAVLIVAYRKNREAQEVLNIVWESLVYHIKSFVTSEDSQKTKITEVTRDFLCFLRSMSRQCTDDNFSSLLLSPVFENVICGRNCFPPAFLSSRLWHMKMTDDMLPTPAAVLVECLLTPAVVPQDDQSSKFQKMMEVLVECGFSSDCPLDLALGVMRRLEVCSYECDGTKALAVYFTWYSLVRKLETDSDKFREVDPDLRSKLLEMVLGFPIARADYFILVADKVADEKQKPFEVWRSLLSSAVTNCTEEDKLNNKMCVHLCSKLMVYLKKDLNQQQCLYISKYICVLGETLPWKDVTSHLVYSLDDIDCQTELLDEPCEQMSGIIDVLLSLYDHVIKYEDNSAEKCSELLRNLGICLTSVCEAILNEVVFLSFVIKLKHVIAFLMLNFCNRGDEVLEHLFICCWMKITHSVERHWGHINSESLTAAVITMLKAVAEHGSLEILRYTLKFWIGLPPKCNDLTPNLRQEMENMFVEMNSSLQKKEEKLKSNKNKTGSTKKRANLSEKLSGTTYSAVPVESAHLNELSEKISSVKIETLAVNGRTSQNVRSADGTLSSDDTTGSSYIKNPFARSFFSSRTRRGSLVPAEVDTNVAMSSKSIEPLYGYDEINVCEKDNVKLTDGTSVEQEDKNIDNPSDVIVQEKHFKSLASEGSSECNLEGENACLDGESSIDHSEAEGDNTSDAESVGGSIQQNKSRLSLRKNHKFEDKQHQLSDKTLEAHNQLESNKMDTKIDKGFFKETETESTTRKSLSVADGSNGNLDVKNSNTEEGSCTENSVNNTIPSTAEAEPLSLFGQVCDRSVAKHQISPSAKSRTEQEAVAEVKSQSEDANQETLLDQNSHFAKPEERRAVRRRKSLPATDLPVRQSPRRPLTKHQKECLKRKRDDIPALYCDLSEDSQSSSFSEMSQDDSQISIPERLSLTKTARTEERQLSFTHLRRVTKPNSLSSLIQKTLEAPEEVMKNEPNKARPFSDVISPKAKVRKIDTTDTEHKSPAGNDHKCPSSEAASVSTIKDSTEHVEKQLEGDAEGNNLSPTKSSEIKASAADNNSSVKDDKENSSSINTVITCTAGSEPVISSIVASTASENSPNRRKSLRPLKRIVRNAVKNSGNNKVGHINKWRTQNRRESLHPLKRLVSNKGKNSKLHMLQRGLLKDKKNLSPVCNIVDQNTIEVAKDLGSPNRAVWEMASISEKKQLTPTRGETVAAKHTTPSPLKDLTQSKIDKYTLRSRLSSDGNVLQAKKCVQHNRQQIKRQTSTGLSPSSEGTVEVSVEINQRDVQDAEDAMRKSRVAEVVKSDPNSKLEQCAETGNTSVNLKDGVSVQLQLASTDKETVGNLVLECAPTGQQGDTNTEKSKSKKLRGRPRKSLSMKPETTAKDVCDVLSETAKHNNVNANDKSTSEGLPQNVGGVKTRKVKLRRDGDTAETHAECDDHVEKAREKEKEESVHKHQSEDKPSNVLHPLKTVTVPNDVCRTEVVSKDVSDSIPQVDESTKVFSNDAVQRESPAEEGCELKFTKDQEKGYVVRSVDEQQSNNLKLVSEPYVHLTNIVAKSNVPNNSNEHLKSTTGNEEQKLVQQSFSDAEDFVEDSQDLTLTASKRTRKWTRRISDGRNARSSLDSRSVPLIAPGSSKANTPELAQLTATREEGEKGTSAVSTLKTTSDTGYCEPVNEIVGSDLLSENTDKQKKSVDSHKCSDTPAEEYSTATILSVHEVDRVNNIDLCKDSVKPVVGKETQEVPNTVEVTAAANVARGLVNVQSVTALTMRRSLRARRKPKTHGCLYSSCCRQVETNKTRIAKRITAKSLRLVRQGQLQKTELPANGGSLLSDVESELCAESDRQSARQKTAKTAAVSGPVLGSTFSKDRPETNTKAESSCLKRKSIADEEVQKDDVSPKKQKKRVSFSDPDVSRTCYFEQYPIEELDKDYLWIANSGRMQAGETLEDQLALHMEELMDYSDSMEEDMSLLDSQSPIWPSLAGCTYPVEEVVKFVVAPTWAKNAVRYFEEQGIKTIGDISSLDEARISTLPVREPKVAIVKKVLKVYEEKLNRIKAGATAAEVNSSRVRRKVQRVQRKAGLAAAIRKSSTQAVVEVVPTSQESNMPSTSARDSSTSDEGNNAPKEGLPKKDSEVGEVAFGSLSSAIVDNKDTLHSHSEEVASADVQKVLPGSSHSSVVEEDTPKIEEKKRAVKLADLQKKDSEVGEVVFESLSSDLVENKGALHNHSEEVASAEVQNVLSGSSHSSVVEEDTPKLEEKKRAVTLEGMQNEDSEVGEVVIESLGSNLVDNKGTLHNHSEEVASAEVQKVLSGSSRSSVVEKDTLKLEDKKLKVNLEGRQKKDSEVGEVVFESLSSPLVDNEGTLHNHSEEVPSTDAQKVLSGSSHSSVVEKDTKDGTYVPVASTSRNQSSPFRAYDKSTKDLTPSNQTVEKELPSNQTVEKELKDDDTELKGGDSQKHVQEELVVVSRESITVINSAKIGGGQTEEVLEKIIPTDSLVSAKETNDSSTQWQEEVLSQKEFDSILGDWNIAMSDDLLESGCMEILENGNCKEDGDVHSNNEFAVSTDLPQTSTAAVFASHSASGSGNKVVADRCTVSCVEKPKDSVECSIPELKTAIEKHSLVTVTHELLRLWKYGERLSQDISVGTLLNRLENAEVKDLKQQRQSVAVQTNSCLCDPNTINALKMIYEKITSSEENKT